MASGVSVVGLSSAEGTRFHYTTTILRCKHELRVSDTGALCYAA